MPSPEVRFFKDRDGCNIAYAVQGTGPMVICPAWWVSHVEKDWRREAFREFCSTLGEELTLVRYDRPGVGLSDRAAVAHSLEHEAALLEDLVEELGAARYALFAASCGGPTAIVHAARHPRQVERLCFYGAYAEGPAICAVEVQEAVLSAVRAHWGLGSRAMADIFLPDQDRETINSFARHQRDAAGSETAAELLKLTYEMDARSHLKDITADTLILHRRDDRAIPFASARMLAAGIKGARLVTLEGRAHPPWVDGGGIATAANDFLRGREVVVETPCEDAGRNCLLDAGNRRLCIDGQPTSLTPLEFAVIQELIRTPNRIVTRDHLLAEVWKQPFEGSNRIDSLIRGLRRKLGPYAESIETAVGHGYRFVGWKKCP